MADTSYTRRKKQKRLHGILFPPHLQSVDLTTSLYVMISSFVQIPTEPPKTRHDAVCPLRKITFLS